MATAGHNLHIFSNCTRCKEDQILDLKLTEIIKVWKQLKKSHQH